MNQLNKTKLEVLEQVERRLDKLNKILTLIKELKENEYFSSGVLDRLLQREQSLMEKLVTAKKPEDIYSYQGEIRGLRYFNNLPGTIEGEVKSLTQVVERLKMKESGNGRRE
jgi:hypothetical protein